MSRRLAWKSLTQPTLESPEQEVSMVSTGTHGGDDPMDNGLPNNLIVSSNAVVPPAEGGGARRTKNEAAGGDLC